MNQQTPEEKKKAEQKRIIITFLAFILFIVVFGFFAYLSYQRYMLDMSMLTPGQQVLYRNQIRTSRNGYLGLLF